MAWIIYFAGSLVAIWAFITGASIVSRWDDDDA